MTLTDVRCKKCGKLLGKVKGVAEIKCPRCGEVNTVNTERQKSAS